MIRSIGARNKTLSGILTGLGRCCMSAKTTVMSFGDGSQGALGLASSHMGLGVDAYEPTPITCLPPDVCGVSAGHYHSLAVTSEGHVWAWGRNNELQLGRGLLSPREHWNDPQKVEGLNRVNVVAAFASGVVSAAIGDDGTLWIWGKSKRGQLGLGKDIMEAVLPCRVEALLEHEIVKVSLGWGHALALTNCGKLFGWGYYADGRLGKIGKPLEASPLDSVAQQFVVEAMEKEKEMPIVWEPCLVEELRDTQVVDIACGLDHSLLLCKDSTLLAGGSNTYGQLGRVEGDLGFHAVDMSLRPFRIAAGLGHSLAVCENDNGKSVVTWGWNQSHQLGREGPENVPIPIAGLSGEGPVSVCGGRVHSLAVMDEGEVWSWGCGRNGRLGLGSSVDEAEPVPIEHLEGREILQAVAGFDHSMVLVNDAG